MEPKKLPWKKYVKFTTVIDDGYFYPTRIEKSLIPECGFGRFNQVEIDANKAICRKKIISVTSDELFTDDKAIVYSNEIEVNRLIGRLMYECHESFDNVVDGISSFSGTLDGKTMYLWTQSGFFNHSTDNYNIQTAKDDEYYYIQSIKYIKPNQELCLNYYDEFEFPKWYINACKKWKQKHSIPNFMKLAPIVKSKL